ncbi:hypothetical protein, partial [Actinomadura luteofluorescens]
MEDQLPGEHDLVIPDAWRRSLHARRGGAPGPKTKVPGPAAAARAVQGYVEKSRGVVEALLEGGAGDPELTDPDTPVNTTSRSLGMRSETSLRL